MGPLFLSASVPVTGRPGFETANRLLIREAVTALAEVVLGRRLLVWGGQPAITPMLWAAAGGLGAQYAKSVHLFQSTFWKDRYPEDNEKFGNVTYVPAVDGDKDMSLRRMREMMLSNYQYSAAIFIGGMDGIVVEYEMFGETNPGAPRICIASPGGMAQALYDQNGGNELQRSSIDFTRMLYTLLEIRTNEPRNTDLGIKM